MAQVTLSGIKRELGSKSNLTELRNKGYVPVVYYAHGEENLFLAVPEARLKPIVFSAETYLINLEIEGVGTKTCILKDFQLDPVTDKIVHVDFHGLKSDEKITVEVAVHLVGSAIGVKEGGLLQHALHKVEVECYPTEIPDKIDVDVSNLKIGDAIHVKDLNLPGLKFVTNPEATIVTVIHKALPKEEAVAETPSPEKSEPEVIQKGKKTEQEEK